MTIAFQLQEGKSVSIDDVTEALSLSLQSEGFQLMPSQLTFRSDFRDQYQVLGEVNVNDTNYDVLFSDKIRKKDSLENPDILEQLGMKQIDGAYCFVRTDSNIVAGFIPPIANLYFEPEEAELRFLKTMGAGIKQNLPNVDSAVVGYLTDRNKPFSYERV